MTHYKYVNTPFGNFAMSKSFMDEPVGHLHENQTSVFLYPLGELDEVPTYQTFDGTEVLDYDVLYAEGARQHPEMKTPHVNITPTFTVNNVDYGATLKAKLFTYSRHAVEEVRGTSEVYVSVYTGGAFSRADLSDSARRKLSEWMNEHRDELIDAEFLDRAEHEKRLSDLAHLRRAAEEARASARKAERAYADAALAEGAARDKLKEYGE